MQRGRSSEAQAYRPLYKTKQWQALRQAVLSRDGYICQKTGRPLRRGRNHPDSAVVHHKTPHKGDLDLFFDIDNLESVTKQWHDSQAQSTERRGYSTEIGDDGWPTDPRHPANR